MFRLFDSAASTLIQKGHLRVIDPKGILHEYGDYSGKPIEIQMNAAAARKIVADPDLYVGECYMDGDLEIIEGDVYGLLSLFMSNARPNEASPVAKGIEKLRLATKRLDQYNPVGQAKANVAHHYDLSAEFYELFLDSDRQYSCAYFENDDSTLEQAQLAKKRHIAAKLAIEPGMRVLDIGSGWGGLAQYLAQSCGAQVTGVTLSEEQHAYSQQRIEIAGLKDKVSIELRDYRSLESSFDRIVSVGMFEHVGIGHYGEFFSKVSDLLASDGAALLHSINRSDGPNATSAWIKKYIFPGGYIPALSEVVPHLEDNGLYITDVEILRMHYAETIRHWSERFDANRKQAEQIYDERFCRMWEFYLAASQCAFRYAGMNNFQIQFVKDQHVLPMTRDYMFKTESTLR